MMQLEILDKSASSGTKMKTKNMSDDHDISNRG